MAIPECITFDLDDTLWDHRRAQGEALADTAREIVGSEALPRFIERFHHHNRTLWEEYRAGEVGAEVVRYQRFARALADAGAEPECAVSLAATYLERYSGLPYLKPGAAEVLERLAAQAQLGCVTDGFTHAQERKMEVTGIRRHFAFVVTSEAVGAAKPSSAIYAAAAAAAGCSPDRIVHVGDSYEHDVVGALAHGLRAVWIPRRDDSSRPADGPEPECVLNDLGELPAALGLDGPAR